MSVRDQAPKNVDTTDQSQHDLRHLDTPDSNIDDLQSHDANDITEDLSTFPEIPSSLGLWLGDESANHVPYANAANKWSIANRGKQEFLGMLLHVTWGQVMPNSKGPLNWKSVGDRLDDFGTQTPPLWGALSIRDKFWHRISANGTTNHANYEPSIPKDLAEYSSPGFSDGYIDAKDTAAFPFVPKLVSGKNYHNLVWTAIKGQDPIGFSFLAY